MNVFMDYKLTNAERETIINFNDAEKTAEIYTCNSGWMRRMEALAAERPDEVRKTKTDEVSATYIVPKKWVKIRPPRILSDEQREQMSQKARERFGYIKTEAAE